MRIVLDASAALAAVVGRSPAPDVLDALEGATIVLAPDLFASEIGNGLWKYVSAGEITVDEAAIALDAALGLVERFVPATTLAQEALREAAHYRHPVYDLCYAIAARREGCAVLTIDSRLHKLLARMSIPVVAMKGRSRS
jgi:predicted nucleic acid-binding protein